MFVDWLIYGLLVFGITKLLNATLFKLKPASRPVAWGLTILIFVVSVAVHTALKVLRFQAISDSAGVSINPPNSLDFANAFISAWLFFTFLNREEKSKEPLPATSPPISITPAFSNTSLREKNTTAQPVPPAPTADRHSALPPTLNSPDSTNKIYSLIAEELEAGRPEKALWTRLFAECDGDEKNTKVLYIKQRAQQLIAAEQAAHAQAALDAQAEQKRNETQEQTIEKALLEQRKVLRKPLLDLCTHLKSGDLYYEAYELLAKAVGSSIRYEGFIFGKYVVTHGDATIYFESMNELRPWFLKNVVPGIEAEV